MAATWFDPPNTFDVPLAQEHIDRVSGVGGRPNACPQAKVDAFYDERFRAFCVDRAYFSLRQLAPELLP